MKIILIIFLFSLTTFIYTHPDRNVKRKEGLVCTPPKEHKDKTFVYPFPVSWHVHVTYIINDKNQFDYASNLKKKVKDHFKDYLGPDCRHGEDETKMCMIEDHAMDDTIGPFPIGEFSMWFSNSHFNLVMTYFVQNRGELSVLFHPNTGCEYEDHSSWAIWVGEPFPLKMSIFTQNQQTNEFDQFAGNMKNPTCVSTNDVCSSPYFEGSFLTCCENLYCHCDYAEDNKCKCLPSK